MQRTCWDFAVVAVISMHLASVVVFAAGPDLMRACHPAVITFWMCLIDMDYGAPVTLMCDLMMRS